MTLLEEYERQNTWRDWERYLMKLPLTAEQTVFDVGCSIGAVTKLLAGRIKKAVGIDSSETLLDEAIKKMPSNCSFILSDIQSADTLQFGKCDGIWSSFTLAYMGDPGAFISRWTNCLNDGGWFAIADIDSLFSCHLPTGSRLLSKTREFEEMSEQSGFYDNRIGRKIRSLMVQGGLDIIVDEEDWYDRELNFRGAAPPEIAENWEARLARLVALKAFFGDRYGDFCREFMNAIKSPDHDARGGVRFCVGIKK